MGRTACKFVDLKHGHGSDLQEALKFLYKLLSFSRVREMFTEGVRENCTGVTVHVSVCVHKVINADIDGGALASRDGCKGYIDVECHKTLRTTLQRDEGSGCYALLVVETLCGRRLRNAVQRDGNS